jgi:hypothetical protein
MENTILNAGIPFTNDGNGRHVKVGEAPADYGGTFGPVWIPESLQRENKTFSF